MNKNRYFFILLFVLISSVGFSQKGFYVQKDSRIKKYQKDMILFLIEDKLLEKKETGKIDVDNYSGSMGVAKYLEIFPVEPNRDKVLLVRFYSLGSHALSYWGLLENKSKFLFYFDEKNVKELECYLKRYDESTSKIILSTLKICDGFNK
ncbi:hypothetical protein [Flavobacterium nitratireducens]|uniref:hypothetical protein n=1 Tax=Flavobacterium nitratireducens TaxID=992289 RepID=UPI0024156C4F|nr:hypothetical protein [Flavobacterium nitratireducens]